MRHPLPVREQLLDGQNCAGCAQRRSRPSPNSGFPSSSDGVSEEEEEEEEARKAAVEELVEDSAVVEAWEVRKEEEEVLLPLLHPTNHGWRPRQTMEGVPTLESRPLGPRNREDVRRCPRRTAAALEEEAAHPRRRWEVDEPSHEALVFGREATAAAEALEVVEEVVQGAVEGAELLLPHHRMN